MKKVQLIAMGTMLLAGLAVAACGQPAEETAPEAPAPVVVDQPTAAPTMEPEPMPTEVEATSDVVDALAADGRFTVLVGALARVGLTETLKAAGPFTVFAPTDEAFAKLAEGTLEGLTDEELMGVLLNHVVAGMVGADAVMSMDGTVLGTMNPSGNATVFVDGETVMIGDATVVEADLAATNGVIHVIDNVLVPAMDDAAGAADDATGAMTDTMTAPMTTTNTTVVTDTNTAP